MNYQVLLAKWISLPFIIAVLLAMFLGREQTQIIMGGNIKEEYFIIMIFLIIIDLQRIIIKWLQK